jgi:subtilisin-like proprotein convertase family protein
LRRIKLIAILGAVKKLQMKRLLGVFMSFFLWTSIAIGQTGFSFWNDIPAAQISLPRGAYPPLQATHYRSLELDFERAANYLRRAPQEGEGGGLVFHLPLPNGEMEAFITEESPVMSPELGKKFPEIRTFIARGAKHRDWTARLDFGPDGFHAAIRTSEGLVYIDPLARGLTHYYTSYFTKDLQWPENMDMPRCGLSDEEIRIAKEIIPLTETQPTTSSFLRSAGIQAVERRTYRLALACTGEYAQAKGGTKSGVMAAMAAAINRVNQVLEAETAIRLVIIPQNDTLLFLDPATDPYTNADNAPSLLSQNTAVLNQFVGANTYDIGHVFTLGCTGNIGGIARYASACSTLKGAGVTCNFSSSTEFIAIQIMAHELGHQFSCAHTWNRCADFSDQFDLDDAFEPGSGSTIMSYAGGCAGQNLQGTSDDYFHVGSLEDFINFSRKFQGNSCATIVPTPNRAPEITLPYTSGFSIPVNTPFELKAQATDLDGDSLTYCWEQYDTGPSVPLGEALFNSPLFRSFRPGPSPVRTFPRIGSIINGEKPIAELLPAYSRKLTFRCTVRDNYPGAGGVTWAQVQFNATDKAGPFVVTSPNTPATSWTAGSTQTVTWDVANTQLDPVNCQYVHIRLSLDGGFTYPYLLAENARNNGSALITVPAVTGTQARVKIEAADNIFFDISNQNFKIEPAAQPGYSLAVQPYNIPLHCQPKVLQFSITTERLLDFSAPLQLELVGQLPPGSTHYFSMNPVQPGDVVMLHIALANAPRDSIQLKVRASTPNGPIQERNLAFFTLGNDFSSLAMQQPADGQKGIVLSSTFKWQGSPNAKSYNFELSGSPRFGDSTLVRQNGITSTNFQPSRLLENNRLFFWRIQPVNECGPGPFSEPFTFHTATTLCNTLQSTNVPLNIPGAGTPTIESRITVTAQGTISDVNVPLMRINKEFVRNLQVSLISPKGTEAILYNGQCALTGRLFLGFDDEAPQAVNGTGVCPPDKGIVFRPIQPLSAFKGESTEGTWTLRIRMLRNESLSSGSLESWSLEFCATQSAPNPTLVRNDTLRVPPGRSNPLRNLELLAQDASAPAEQLLFTLVKAPTKGTLSADGVSLSVGSRFTQAAVNALKVKYQHNGNTPESDFFTFVLQNGQGGFLPTRRFNIAMDPTAPVATKNLAKKENTLRIFPNPAQDYFQVEWDTPLTDSGRIILFNVQGQRLLEESIEAGQQSLSLSSANLPEGLYFLRVEGGGDWFSVRRLAVQR